MVVDDETHVREVLIEALEAEGCEVVSAESGEIALALFDQSEGKFDAVFTDIGMPAMSGWELGRNQRALEQCRSRLSAAGPTPSACRRETPEGRLGMVAKTFDIDRISKIAQEIAQRKQRNHFRH